MRVLVVADIHGNRAALEAIQEPFDACVCIGDLVDYGPEPGPCVEWVRENALYCVRGNHDHGVAQDVAVSGVAGFRFLTSITRPLTVGAPHRQPAPISGRFADLADVLDRRQDLPARPRHAARPDGRIRLAGQGFLGPAHRRAARRLHPRAATRTSPTRFR